ncbi:hypothetical protein ACOME3_007356 [Neoechinorhynchus agilis]
MNINGSMSQMQYIQHEQTNATPCTCAYEERQGSDEYMNNNDNMHTNTMHTTRTKSAQSCTCAYSYKNKQGSDKYVNTNGHIGTKCNKYEANKHARIHEKRVFL